VNRPTDHETEDCHSGLTVLFVCLFEDAAIVAEYKSMATEW